MQNTGVDGLPLARSVSLCYCASLVFHRVSSDNYYMVAGIRDAPKMKPNDFDDPALSFNPITMSKVSFIQ